MTEANYIPAREEVYARGAFEREMRSHKWPDGVMISIMLYDMPTIATCQRLIKQHGQQTALMKICHMIDYYSEQGVESAL